MKFEKIDFDNLDQYLNQNKTFWDKISLPIHHNIINPLRDFYHGLKHFPSNIRRWFMFVWSYRTWDSNYSLEALKISLEGQVECFKSSQLPSVNIEKYIKDISICITLINRINADDYFTEQYEKLDKISFKKSHKYCADMSQQDMELLFKKLRKIKYWWD